MPLNRKTQPALGAPDRVKLQERLEQTERNVSEAEWHIDRMRDLVRQHQRGGRDLRLAANVLRQFEERLFTYIDERDRLRKELGL
jgi:predicted RNase H-like nuclease (RuvC/YqgF family)